MTFQPDDGGETIEREIFHFPGGGVAMGMYNLDDSIRDFARACMTYALDRSLAALHVHQKHYPQSL